MTRLDYVGYCVNNNNWHDKQSQTNSVNYGRRVNHTQVSRYTYLKVLFYIMYFHYYRYTVIYCIYYILCIPRYYKCLYIIYYNIYKTPPRYDRTAHNII